MRDLTQPERLYQVVIEGLEQEFPPPRTLEARPNNLPAQLTRFIGRGEEIARIRQLLASHRLVTLTGPGGTGKTRLGLQVASEALTDFEEGVFFVDLSAVTLPELVPATIASALRLREEPGRPLLDTLAGHLRDKEFLLVLDNFEQVVEAGERLVAPLLLVAPGLKVLVTSRVPLHLHGEQQFPVPPLGLADPRQLSDLGALARFEAVALFAERAAAVKADFCLTDENAASVAEITARLDGLPLAIELAASRVKLLAPQALLGRLEQRLPLLRAQERNLPERQRTLRRTIEWSYELLDQAEQRMFRRLAVFVGGADLQAVEAVANPEGQLDLDTLDGLTSLVDNNLVRSVDTPEGEPRFSMLETIREYGLERLAESGEEPAVRRRHAEHATRVAQQASEALSGPDQAKLTHSLERDLDNFRSALNWALQTDEAEQGLQLAATLRNFWRLGGHVREGMRWLRELIALPGATEPTPLRARALTTAADLISWVGETEAYLRFAEEAVSIYRDLGDSRGLADALEELGVAQMSVGRLEVARASLEEAKERNVHLGNRQKVGECNMTLGLLALLEGRPGQARPHFEDAWKIFTDLGDAWWIAFAQFSLGVVDRKEGDHPAAEKRFHASLLAFRNLDNLMGIRWALKAFADLALFRGQHERALRLVGASDALRERVGESVLEKAIRGDVGQTARSYLEEATGEGLYQEGQAMEFDDAVAYALQQGT
ncbi:MAG TPA: NB-ARC domain-containing protein [Nitriliruptorales bacterium]|nr:NB-ARC domain-containing protein [Nitriliruptorales bacterium]